MANKLKAGFDGPNKRFTLQMVDEDTGDIVASWGNVMLELGQVPAVGTPDDPGTTMGKEIKLRETKGCDSEGNPVYCMMPRSEWYTSPLTLHPET